jgi:type IV pilus modification protein PilV
MEAAMHEQDREGGFTLIEVLIAVVILVFGLLAVMNLMVVAVSSTMAANFSTITTAAATEQMERLEDLTTIAGGPAIGTGGSLDSDQAGFFRVDTSSNAVIR